jgi:hypothetical protein
MGLSVSKPTTLLRTDSEGYLVRTTIVNPTKEEKQAAKLQKQQLQQQLGKAGYKAIVPQATETIERFRFS